MNDKTKIQFTIPDGTPEEQIAHIAAMKGVILTMAKLTGEEVDTKPFDEAIKKLSCDPVENTQ